MRTFAFATASYVEVRQAATALKKRTSFMKLKEEGQSGIEMYQDQFGYYQYRVKPAKLVERKVSHTAWIGGRTLYLLPMDAYKKFVRQGLLPTLRCGKLYQLSPQTNLRFRKAYNLIKGA